MTAFTAPPLDLGIPPLFYYLCGAGSLLLLAIVIGLEAFVLRRMLPGAKSLRDSAVANLVSTLLGVPLFFLAAEPIFRMEEAWAYVLLVATWLLSVAIEAGILRLLERSLSWRQILKASLAANLLSYLLLIAVLLVSLTVA